MTKFWAHMHVGHSVSFLGDSWGDGGFSTDSDGNPTRDGNRNTVANYSVTEADATDDVDLIRDAYAGDGARIGDRDSFADWLHEQGFEGDEIHDLCKRFADELTYSCAYCGREVRCLPESTPVAGASDDEAWGELAEGHEPDCEWVQTRAHRLELGV